MCVSIHAHYIAVGAVENYDDVQVMAYSLYCGLFSFKMESVVDRLLHVKFMRSISKVGLFSPVRIGT